MTAPRRRGRCRASSPPCRVARIELKRPTLEDVFVAYRAGDGPARCPSVARPEGHRRMSKVWQIAVREFVATVFTKGFLIGLLIVPVIAGILALVGPRLFGDRSLTVEGEIAVIDPTGVVLPRVRDAMAARSSPAAVTEIIERARAGGAADIVIDMLGATTELTLVERSAQSDVEEEKRWLTEERPGARHLALAVVHANAVEPASGDLRQLRSLRSCSPRRARGGRGAQPLARGDPRCPRGGAWLGSRGAGARHDGAARAFRERGRRAASAIRCSASTSSCRWRSWCC